MIFVYPVVCSNNVDNRILPAICRSLEKFYLSNICEAFSSGDLIPKSVWDPRRKVYGPVVLENYNNGDSDIILESIDNHGLHSWYSSAGFKGDIDEQKLIDIVNELNKKIEEANQTTINMDNIKYKLDRYPNIVQNKSVDIAKVAADYKATADEYINLYNKFLDNLGEVKPLADDAKTEVLDVQKRKKNAANPTNYDPQPVLNAINNINRSIENEKKRYSATIKTIENRYKTFADYIINQEREQQRQKERAEDKALRDKQAKEREEDRAREKAEREAEAKRGGRGGSWRMQEVHNIGFDPTMATVEVRIQYVGGDYSSNDVYNRDAKVNMPVGVKLVPSVVPSDSIRYALLSDAFRGSAEKSIVAFGRRVFRSIIHYAEKFVRWVTGRNIDIAKAITKDEISRQVLYAPQHIINASGFKRQAYTSSFYQYTSGVVVLNKEEINEIDDVLNDRKFMYSILKMGWSSICVMDDVSEEALFISLVDGGYIHRLPYAYIFGSIGMTTTYENIDKLQKHTGPFKRSEGRGFTPFGQKVVKESISEIFDRLAYERDKSIRRSSSISLDSDSYFRRH